MCDVRVCVCVCFFQILVCLRVVFIFLPVDTVLVDFLVVPSSCFDVEPHTPKRTQVHFSEVYLCVPCRRGDLSPGLLLVLPSLSDKSYGRRRKPKTSYTYKFPHCSNEEVPEGNGGVTLV